MARSITAQLLLFMLIAGGCFTSEVNAAPLTIVKDGKAQAVLVVQKDEPKAAAAAKAIQETIEKMSGASLDAIDDGQPTDAAIQIHVGTTSAAAANKVAIPSGHDTTINEDAFEQEGYILKTVGNTIIVAGNNDGPYRGTKYAAYALLEKLGCRWYFPGAFGEVIPQQKTVTVPNLDVRSKPDFAVRMIWLSGWVPTTRDERKLYNEWCVKIGFSDRMYPVAGDGFLGSLVPANEYYEKEPELFAMNKAGKRELRKHSKAMGYYNRHVMLCMSNPRVFDIATKVIDEHYAGKRKLDIATPIGIGISPPDGAPFCYCKPCLETSQNFNYPTYVHERMQSEEIFGFANKLAKHYPDKWVATMAYSLREMAPQGIKLNPNISVTIAPISCCVLHDMKDPSCWRRQEYVHNLKQFRKQTPHIMIYDYNPGQLTGMWLPERDVANMAVNAKVYRDINIKGMAREGRKAFMQTWISYYMTGKLLWDADADVEALKKDFYNTFFGESAGSHIKAWFDACEVQLTKSDAHVHEDWMINHVYNVAFTSSIHKHVEAAKAASGSMTDVQRKRLEVFLLIADHLEAFSKMCEAEKNLDYAAAARFAQNMYDNQAKLGEIDSFMMTHHKGKPRKYFVEGRKVEFDALAAKTGGAEGELVDDVPLNASFTRDPFNQGVIEEWYLPEHNTSNWSQKDTYVLWDQQDEPLNARGNDYDGYGWYRFNLNVDKKLAGKPLKLWLGGLINEGWVWVNGEYAGHKKHKIWWHHWHDLELDVSELIKPGENVIAVRVWNDAEVGGMHRRGFLWSPKQ